VAPSEAAANCGLDLFGDLPPGGLGDQADVLAESGIGQVSTRQGGAAEEDQVAPRDAG